MSTFSKVTCFCDFLFFPGRLGLKSSVSSFDESLLETSLREFKKKESYIRNKISRFRLVRDECVNRLQSEKEVIDTEHGSCHGNKAME